MPALSAIAPALTTEASNRRHQARLNGAAHGLFCDLGDDNGGVVLDINEVGFGLQSIKPLAQGATLNFGLELSFGLRAVGEAHVVWARGTRTGLRFTPNCRGVTSLYKELMGADRGIQQPQAANILPSDCGSVRLPRHAGVSYVSDFFAQLVRTTGADGGALALFEQGRLLCRASFGAAPPAGTEVSSVTGLTGECVHTHAVVYCPNTADDPRVNAAAAARMNVNAAVVLPCECEDKSGLIELFSSIAGTLSPEDVLPHVHQLLDREGLSAEPEGSPASSALSASSPAAPEAPPQPQRPAATPNADEIANSASTPASENPVSVADITRLYRSLLSRSARYRLQLGIALALMALFGLALLAHGIHRSSLQAAAVPAAATHVLPAETLPSPPAPIVQRPRKPVKKSRTDTDSQTTDNTDNLETYKIPAVPSTRPAESPQAPVLAFAPSVHSAGEVVTTAPAAAPLPPPASTGVREGKLLFKLDPVYPPAAAGKAGSVTVRIEVAENGTVRAITVLHSDDPLFSQAASAAISRWRYAPSVLDGQRVSAEHLITLNFR